MYYHICIETNNVYKDHIAHYELDILNLEEIKERFVSPYLNGMSIGIQGSEVHCSKIINFVIKKSNFRFDQVINLSKQCMNSKKALYTMHNKKNNISSNFEIGELILNTPMALKNILQNVNLETLCSSEGLKEDVCHNEKTSHIEFQENIFIAHGRNEKTNNEVESFIKSLGFNPIIGGLWDFVA